MQKDHPQMRIKAFILLFLLFSINKLFSQEDLNAKLYVRATTSVSGQEFYIDILCSNSETKLLFRIKTHFNDNKFNKDKAVLSYRQLLESPKYLDIANDTVKLYINKLDSIARSYTDYDTDSLIISNSKHKDYINLIDEILNSPIDKLNDSLNRVVIDGTSFKVEILKNGQNSIVFSRSPDLKSNPYIYRLISESMNLYRSYKANNFLDKRRTSGY